MGSTVSRPSSSIPSPPPTPAAPTIARSTITGTGTLIAGAGQGFNKATVQRYARHLEEQGLSASTRNVRLTAVRRLAAEAADNGLIEPAVAAAIGRVKGAKQQGTRSGNWLTVDQAEQLINCTGYFAPEGETRPRPARRAHRLRPAPQRSL